MTKLAVGSHQAERYDRVARSLHWLVAALAVAVVALGWAIGAAPRNSPSRDLLLLLHRSIGLTVLAAMLLTILLPKDVRAGPPWLLPGLEGLVLIAIILGDPGRISRRSAVLRALSITLVGLLVIDALWATVLLVEELIHGGHITESADELLSSGSLVWVSNNIAFSLLYWELDSGGPEARAANASGTADFHFAQAYDGDEPSGWEPRFVDYLYIAFATSTAFGPPDHARPVSHQAKVMLMLQACISLITLVLIASRAVSTLS